MRYVELAYMVAKVMHKDVTRRDGRRFFEHIKSVKEIVIKELPDPTLRKAILAILHDVYEDEHIELASVSDVFGDHVAEQVQLLSKKHFTYYVNEKERVELE